ncbi:MAG: hypothetical protein AAGB34_10910, partial [Planctomycetota bacterium]
VQAFGESVQDSSQYGDDAHYFPVLTLAFTDGPIVADGVEEELAATFQVAGSEAAAQTFLINASGVDLGELEEVGDAWVIPIEGEPFRFKTNHQ